jgi:myo-inositol-1(or 4)-monophosphatase
MRPDAFLATAMAAADAAADVAAAVIRPFFRSALAADTKDDRSPVTIADRSAEQAMRAVLAQRFPDHGIMGEEFGLDRGAARYRWVLDPVDGTRAFITGRPTFGTLIALLEDGAPILGIIDQPISRERWRGMAGQPTTFNGSPAQTRPCPALDQAELSCTAPEIFSGPEAARWRGLQAATRRTSWGGDCYAYGLLAAGHIDVIAEAGLKIWDWAALVPIIEGAGGRITDWSGQPLHAESDGTVVAVGNPALAGAVVGSLAERDGASDE